MNNFVNIKKLEKIYYSQEFLKGISFLGGGGRETKKKLSMVQQNSLTASYPLKLLN